MSANSLVAPYEGIPALRKTAIEDAQRTQASVLDACSRSGEDPPPYILSELIGKGSFGRVYRAASATHGKAVAVKIISIEEGDSLHPREADTFRDILKEVQTLKLLNDSGAKNINIVLDTLLVGQSVWMITEYCAGGSVATLMKPTKGLNERWIIPILREVTEAMHWVHKQGIIHRDIKCANVLITETGGVQLCDFGVAAIIETKFHKRSTVTGTLQWMAPELFDSTVFYGIEVDIWAFGSMAYEMATGLPPNATNIVDLAHFGSYLKDNCPRLHGDQYSLGLKDIIAYCMVQEPSQRPRIEQVQEHKYIANTEQEYPAHTLSRLVNAYRLWGAQGGVRESLFSPGGAQGLSEESSENPSHWAHQWDFNITDEARVGLDTTDAQAVFDVYGADVNIARRLPATQSRRRLPPNIKPLKVPLERVFDPNTITNYEDHARVFYGRDVRLPATDLPLRNEVDQSTLRESLIDLDASLDGNSLAQFTDLSTLRAVSSATNASHTHQTLQDHRQTREWKFPVMTATSRSLDNEQTFSNAQSSTPDWQSPHDTGHGQASRTMLLMPSDRTSTLSLIDLDMSLVGADYSRPSTADSDMISDVSSTPFDLEQRVVAPMNTSRPREPSIYVPDELGLYAAHQQDEDDDYSDGYIEPSLSSQATFNTQVGHDPSEHSVSAHGELIQDDGAEEDGYSTVSSSLSRSPTLETLPSIPSPPSIRVLLGNGSPDEVKVELQRLILSMSEHLQVAGDTLAGQLAKG